MNLMVDSKEGRTAVARPATGQVLERRSSRGHTYALRFRAYGKRQYLNLGTSHDGWTRRRAEEELANVLADVRRGIWQPPQRKPERVDPPPAEPTLHEFASEWIAMRELEGLADKTIADLRWSLSNHLLPVFAGHRLSEITPQEVDRYKTDKARERQELERARARGEKIRERGLSNNSINHTLSDLAQVLETAVEYGLINVNPASGKRRRLKSTRPNRPWVEPEQLPGLLDAAKEHGAVGRVLLAVLAGAGLRIGEALALRWRNVDLPTGTLHVTDSKTEAGIRSVDLTHALREELTVWKAETDFAGPDDYVIPTEKGRKQSSSNLRRDVLAKAVTAANVKLAKDGIAQIGKLGFHGLRRTYASLRCACGDDVAYTSRQIGHTDARFTLKAYTMATRRRERLSGPHLKAYDRAIEWARMGTNGMLERVPATAEATKNPA
jgi:integrase